MRAFLCSQWVCCLLSEHTPCAVPRAHGQELQGVKMGASPGSSGSSPSGGQEGSLGTASHSPGCRGWEGSSLLIC